jgi:hypothetical protein
MEDGWQEVYFEQMNFNSMMPRLPSAITPFEFL